MVTSNQGQNYPNLDSFSKFQDCSLDPVYNAFKYDVWVQTPTSVQHRKKQFLKLMNFSLDNDHLDDDDGNQSEDSEKFDDRITDSGDAAVYEESTSSGSDSSRLGVLREDFNSRHENLGCSLSCSQKVAEGNSLLIRNDKDSGPLVQKLVDRQMKVAGTMARTMNRLKTQWLSRLRSMACVVDGQERCDSADHVHRTKVQRVKVRQNKKQVKEFSAVFIGQDFQAHQGSILTMKFSQDGRYLATSGEDGVVRIWEVVEDDRCNDTDIPDIDPGCIYFTVNHLSELAPLVAEKQKLSMLKSLRKTSDSACVIVPPKVFRILEKPVHEFRGHKGEVLDLSWSTDNLLLSSSVDETVCLWRVGTDHCIKVFPHSNYVTCVQFNPVDDGYFISGSIDGKVRIWSISSSQVVDWSDIGEIITAVTYSPDGKGGIIGSMTGCCRFFTLSDHQFQLEDSVCLNGKKKLPYKRIIGFQFCPQDASKVLVTCADSHVRILDGINVIGKYKGQRNGGNQLCASFTSDGKHIVSACEDSNIYVWNRNIQNETSLYQQKTVRSFECFSGDASVVLPWSGLKENNWRLPNSSSSSPNNYFSVGHDLFLESLPKASATWPEEKLPTSDMSSGLYKSQYKFFKSSLQRLGGCHSWGLVIVTAGWDGHIRSFLNYGLPVTL